nr:hypothetical protein [Tanacetum cinerariifolium]
MTWTYFQSVGAEADFNNMVSSTVVSLIPTHRVHIDHPKDQILRDPKSVVQTRGMAKKSYGAHAFVSYIHKQRRTNHKDYENCLFVCFLSQMKPKKKAWRLVDLPYGKKAIGTKWVYRNKKDEKGIVVRNKARLLAQGHRQEEMIDYDEAFAPVARIEAIKIFLAFASLMGFIVYQMDIKSAFLYDTIEEECKKQTIVATSTTEAECVDAANYQNTKSNAEFHQIVDFLTSSSIHYSLTFWNTATSQTINDEKQIHAIVDGKTVGEGTGSGPGCQEKMGGAMDQVRPEGASIQSIDPPLSTGFHPFKTGTSKRHSLVRRKVSKQGRKNLKSQQKFQDIDDLVDEETLSTARPDISAARPDISAARPEVSTAEPKTPTTTTLFDDDDVSIIDTLVKMKNQKAKEKEIDFKDADDTTRPIRSITTHQPLPTIDPKDKGKGILQESEPVKK